MGGRRACLHVPFERFPQVAGGLQPGDLVFFYGLDHMGIYLGGDGIDECLPSGNNSCPVWVLGPDSEFEILAPAFDTEASWVDPADGTVALVHAHTTGAKRGKLCPAGTAGASTLPVARLIRVDSANKIVVGGLNVVDAI